MPGFGGSLSFAFYFSTLPRRRTLLAIAFVCVAAPALARHGGPWCGTTAETHNETLFLHRQALRARSAGLGLRPLTTPPVSGNRDIGNIAIIEDSDGVVVRQNQFNLDLKTLQFTPTAPKPRATATP